QPLLGILRGRWRDEHERRVARRKLDIAVRLLPEQRPDDVLPRLPAARVLELGQRRHHAQRTRQPAVHMRERGQAKAAPGLVGLERPFARGEDVVLRRGREGHALRLGRRLPALPRLERDLMPASDQLAAQRDDRERMPRVAERAEEKARYAASSASWAIWRS